MAPTEYQPFCVIFPNTSRLQFGDERYSLPADMVSCADDMPLIPTPLPRVLLQQDQTPPKISAVQRGIFRLIFTTRAMTRSRSSDRGSCRASARCSLSATNATSRAGARRRRAGTGRPRPCRLRFGRRLAPSVTRQAGGVMRFQASLSPRTISAPACLAYLHDLIGEPVGIRT
jgi:hypothetical protein